MSRFFQLTGSLTNPLDGVDLDNRESPVLADFNNDGALDLLVGSSNGQANYLLNEGTATNPVFKLKTGSDSPFNGLGVGSLAAFAVGDLDRDGDLDFGASDVFGNFRYFENTGDEFQAAFLERTGGNNPFGSIRESSQQRPILGDLDGDGDLDLLLGRIEGQLSYYENTGGPNTAAFIKRTGTANPLPSNDFGSNAAPALVDLDGDLDLDLVVGESNGALFYFENTGSGAAATLVQRTGDDNPFNGIDVGNASTPTFGDIDADGDPDLIVGDQFGQMKVFVNNDAPYLTPVSRSLPATNEDTASQTTTVEALLADIWADGDARAVKGLAITSTTGAGTWQYSVNGSTWRAMGAVSEDSALLLAAGTALRYLPDGTNGETATLSFHAWDQTSGTPSTDATRQTADTRSNGGTTAFSSTSSTASLVVTAVNDAPVTVADTAIAAAGTSVMVSVLANDSDVDGGPLTVSNVSPGSSGSTGIEPGSQAVRYTPNPGFSGFDTFTYTASDGAGGFTPGSVRVLVASHTGDGGNNPMFATAGADFVLAYGGNDYIQAFGGADYIDAGEGQDTVFGGSGADTQLGGGGNDTFYATSFELLGDSIDGGTGTDKLVLTGSTNFILPVFSFSNLEQLSFPSSITVDQTSLLDLSSLHLTGAGRTINGGFASNQIIGSKSNDALNGGGGNDSLNGSAGNDTVQGGTGSDTLNGGVGNDTLAGNTTAASDGVMDTFVFNTALNAATNVDQILRFEANGIDRIALDSGIFAAVAANGTNQLDATELVVAAGASASLPAHFILFDTTTGNLYYDADGSASGARVLFASLGSSYTGAVDAADFLVGSYPA